MDVPSEVKSTVSQGRLLDLSTRIKLQARLCPYDVLEAPAEHPLCGGGQGTLVGGAIHRLLLPQHVLRLIAEVTT